MRKLLVANRGEIAIRVLRSAAELGLSTVAVFSEDDARSLHVSRAGDAHRLRGSGAAAYLDVDAIVAAARERGCDAIHPGYGFLSENARFARRCAGEGITFVGPAPETLELLGDKVRARDLARHCGVPVLEGTGRATLAEAGTFLAGLGAGGAVLIKAVAGGGGRGMRAVASADELEQAYARCRSEALQAFGDGALYLERLMPRARHVEVQVLGDRHGAVTHLGERECSLQRRYQKLVEIAPCPSLGERLRERLLADAVRIARELGLSNAATFEFLVEDGAVSAESPLDGGRYAFIEANPRLQVEHTVTEEVMDVDLVRLQLQLAGGSTLADVGLGDGPPAPRGFAVETRVNAETMDATGRVLPGAGTILRFDLPAGHGVRIDTCGHVGYAPNPRFDSLLAKVIVRSSSPRFADAAARARRALSELTIEGLETNVALLRRLVSHPDFVANRIHTGFVEEHAAALLAPEPGREQTGDGPPRRRQSAGATVDASDPLAVLAYGKGDSDAADRGGGGPAPVPVSAGGLDGTVVIQAPMQGTIVSIEVGEGSVVRLREPILVLNAMKMEHVVEAAVGGVVRRLAVSPGDTVPEGHPLVFIEVREMGGAEASVGAGEDLDQVRADLAELQSRRAATRDEARPAAVARRRRIGGRTARENVAALCDPGTFVEYGAFAIAAQRARRTVEELVRETPADGLVAGIGRVNGALFDAARAECAVAAYDYTVLAGTQGYHNHLKKDRLFDLVERLRIPLVLFTEGGGGRPGDTDGPGVTGLVSMAFRLYGQLSGLVPLVGISSGRCFAGNAALLGSSDVVIATESSNIGMGGPAMIEGGGLGVFRPEEVGPIGVQTANGVVDVAAADESEAARIARQYLSYFQGRLATWECADQRLLRSIVPENRLRVYDVRSVVETLADTGSVLELRRHFGAGMITALARIEGRPVGIVANNPRHLSGAIDSAGADKAARFMQLCDAFDIPLLFLCDTPGIMVGPEVEKTALVRHAARMFVVGASLTVPVVTLVLRKAYGLGAQAMAAGSHRSPIYTAAWPTAEFGPMGLEGAVKLGYRNELAAVEDPATRRRMFEEMVAREYARGRALNAASYFDIDDVIDPADSRASIAALLRSAPTPAPRSGKKRPCIDTW